MRLRRDVLHSYQARDSQAAQQKWTQRRQNAFNWTLMERKVFFYSCFLLISWNICQPVCRCLNNGLSWFLSGSPSCLAIIPSATTTLQQPQAHWAKASVQVNQKLAGHPGEGSLSRSLNCRRANWISGGTQSHAAIPKAASETDHQAQELQSQIPFSDQLVHPNAAQPTIQTGLTRLNNRSPLGPMTWSDSGSAVPSAKNSSVAVMEKNTLSAQCSTRQNGCRKHPGGAQM
ncbi:uncharacterized protein LOC122980835 isoform X1 [Thunnus albacares]|uniref:uncharacterized protein LOC122980835 isoform X1 n=1 Tax=Thunnus albacares TaxID=8236 RepID=UPI001CF6DBF0|nr:uncharacterized protein LOC122980835 isoform X1 [Thunnus albacares]XP_044205157.1 uncharacterized protein LOC122980835 isoform X1 [Thunnus albacares]XP_044205166.1 uncharacterized protein LOC122980835 isoform X1 [Thunnus albacares]